MVDCDASRVMATSDIDGLVNLTESPHIQRMKYGEFARKASG